MPGCNAPVPAPLQSEQLCILHFTFSFEKACAGLRREIAMGIAARERNEQIAKYLADSATKLAAIAAGSPRLSDNLKRRIVSAIFTLMNVRESLDRSARFRIPRLGARN